MQGRIFWKPFLINKQGRCGETYSREMWIESQRTLLAMFASSLQENINLSNEYFFIFEGFIHQGILVMR